MMQSRLSLSLLVLLLAGCSLPFGGGAAVSNVPVAMVETTTDARRVLALGEEELLVNLLDLNVKPVAANVNLPEKVAQTTPDQLACIELFPSAGDISIETLATFTPDLIIGTSFFIESAGYNKLSAIAPTVALASSDSLQSYLDTATVLGKTEAAQRTVASFRQRVEAEATRIGAGNKTLSLATVYPGPSVAVWVDGPSPIPALVRDMGVTLNPDSAAVEKIGVKSGRAFVSLEQLNLLGGTTIVLLQSNTVEGETEAVRDTEVNALWQALPAVKTGRVVTLDRLGYPGLRGQNALLDQLVTMLESS